ncbi:MAG: SAM-dependent methyltransferase [Candidatus Helarchaeota archaeon]
MIKDKKIKTINYPISIFQNFIIVWYIYMGIKLRIFDLMSHHKSCNPEFIANHLNLREQIVKNWCDAMYSEGLFKRDNNNYSLTNWTKKYLCTNSKNYIGFIITSLENFSTAFSNFENNFKSDREFFRYTPNQMLGIVENIAPIANYLIPLICNEISDISRPYRVLDIGCGLGYYLFNLSKKYSDLKGLGIDIEQIIIDRAKSLAKEKKLDKRIRFKKVDVFKFQSNQNFNVIILSNIVQSFNIEQNKLLFQNLSNFLDDDGKIIMIDCLLDENKVDAKFNILFNLYLKFESLNARLYTLNELIDIVKNTALKVINHKNLMLGIDLIILKKI